MKQKKVIYIVGLLVLLTVAAGVAYRARRPKNSGVAVVPQGVYAGGEVSFYLQGDDVWGSDKMGKSSCKMASSGCLTTALAAGLEMEMREEDPAYELTPGELNRLFTESGVYNSSGDIVWGKIQTAINPVEVYVGQKVDSAIIDECLEAGKYPVVRVRVGGSGAMHWVLIVASDDSMYYCMDPLNREKTVVPLSSFGNIIYSIRCVSW